MVGLDDDCTGRWMALVGNAFYVDASGAGSVSVPSCGWTNLGQGALRIVDGWRFGAMWERLSSRCPGEMPHAGGRPNGRRPPTGGLKMRIKTTMAAVLGFVLMTGGTAGAQHHGRAPAGDLVQ